MTLGRSFNLLGLTFFVHKLEMVVSVLFILFKLCEGHSDI